MSSNFGVQIDGPYSPEPDFGKIPSVDEFASDLERLSGAALEDPETYLAVTKARQKRAAQEREEDRKALQELYDGTATKRIQERLAKVNEEIAAGISEFGMFKAPEKPAIDGWDSAATLLVQLMDFNRADEIAQIPSYLRDQRYQNEILPNARAEFEARQGMNQARVGSLEKERSDLYDSLDRNASVEGQEKRALITQYMNQIRDRYLRPEVRAMAGMRLASLDPDQFGIYGTPEGQEELKRLTLNDELTGEKIETEGFKQVNYKARTDLTESQKQKIDTLLPGMVGIQNAQLILYGKRGEQIDATIDWLETKTRYYPEELRMKMIQSEVALGMMRLAFDRQDYTMYDSSRKFRLDFVQAALTDLEKQQNEAGDQLKGANDAVAKARENVGKLKGGFADEAAIKAAEKALDDAIKNAGVAKAKYDQIVSDREEKRKELEGLQFGSYTPSTPAPVGSGERVLPSGARVKKVG